MNHVDSSGCRSISRIAEDRDDVGSQIDSAGSLVESDTQIFNPKKILNIGTSRLISIGSNSKIQDTSRTGIVASERGGSRRLLASEPIESDWGTIDSSSFRTIVTFRASHFPS